MYSPKKLKSVLTNKAKLNRLSSVIRRKYRALKLGRTETDESLQRLFEPILNPLDKLVHHAEATATTASPSLLRETSKIEYPKGSTKDIGIQTKNGEEEEVVSRLPAIEISTPTAAKDMNPPSSGAELTPGSEEVFLHDPEEEEKDERTDTLDDASILERTLQVREAFRASTPSAVKEYLRDIPRLARNYIKGFLSDTTNEYDISYGVHIDPATDKLYMGNKELDIGKNSELRIDEHTFAGTEGLYELIFKQKPKEYTVTDVDRSNYKKILDLTNVTRRGFDPTRQRKGSRGEKYRKIVKPTFGRPKSSGQGFMINSIVAPQYVYFNDPNELVDRLRLLIASGLAGNDAHRNEIESIIEELKEGGYIY